MKITRDNIRIQLDILTKSIKIRKEYIKQGLPAESKESLLDMSIFIIANIQLLSPDFTIDKGDPQFQRAMELQRQVRMLER